MAEKNKKFYITTSIAYTNASPHIGFSLELLQADVIARYRRILRDDVFFLTGTDEHGIKIAKAAEKAKKEVAVFVEEISSEFKKLAEILNISNDDFIRTSDKKRHWPTVQNIWEKLKEKGDIYKKNYKGFYCVGCESFVKESDLVDGKCPNHQQKPELVEEENYFFKLSNYADRVKKAIEKEEIKIIPKNRKKEIISFIDQGVEDISCSRSKDNLKWGIPVPGDESQIIYIWFEALINYISALESSNKEKYWPADVHCIGKDIFRFHALLWPAMLFSLKLPLPKSILIHGFITVGGQKMSKSLGNVVDPFELVEKYGVDPVRYFLLREISPTEDGDFTYEKFEERYNSDLAKGLGNLVARVITLAEKNKIEKSKEAFKKEIDKAKKECKKALEEFRFNESLAAIWELIGFCDKLIEKEKPWEGDKPEIISGLLYVLEEISKLLKPFLPETSEKILEQVKTKENISLFPRI